ncbi:MAG: hypothetical protein LBL87_07345 [Ruminococcus sp.]|jgi:hypothetical protein|nr:hypothetical protein [Ruminococcus sp.]
MDERTTVRYSDLVAAKLRRAAVLKNDIVFSMSYEGSASAGAVKIPVRDREVAAVDYDKANGASPDGSTTVYQTLIINRDKAVNEIIDGYDAATVPDDLIADRLDSAGYSLAYALDNDGANVLLSEGTRANIGSLTANNVYDMIVDARTKLSKANVPDDGRRYILVTPEVYAYLLRDTVNFIGASALSDEIKATGAIGKVAGFNVYEWNDSTANLCFIAGHPSYAVRAEEFSVPVKVVNLDGDANYIGACAVKGRMVYAHKVLKQQAILCVFCPEDLKLSRTGTAGSLTVTVANDDNDTYVYRVNPSERAVFDEDADGTAFTSGGTITGLNEGDILEIVRTYDGAVDAVGYLTV